MARPIRVLMVLDSLQLRRSRKSDCGNWAGTNRPPAGVGGQPRSGHPGPQCPAGQAHRGRTRSAVPVGEQASGPGGFRRLVQTLRRSDVDVVHAHLGYSAALVPLAAKLADKPSVATLHLSPQRNLSRGEFLKERLYVRIPARFGRLVLVSQHAFDQYAKVHGPARDTWRMIPNGVDLARYTVRTGPRSSDKPVWRWWQRFVRTRITST